jgi:hypothetical protein
MAILLPKSELRPITRLFGMHYDFTSTAIRALGGKVGKAIYWPGTDLGIQDFDMVTIGNHVFFGSPSYLITSDALGSAPIEIQDGANVLQIESSCRLAPKLEVTRSLEVEHSLNVTRSMLLTLFGLETGTVDLLRLPGFLMRV